MLACKYNEIDIDAHYAYNKGVDMTTKELIKLLRSDGWFEVDQRGSHRHFKHRSKPGKITIPMHKGDIKIKTAESILKQAGIDKNKNGG